MMLNIVLMLTVMMRILVVGDFVGLLQNRVAGEETSPRVLRATVHIRDLAMIRDSEDRMSSVTEHYRCAVYRVVFDQPLYAASVDVHQYHASEGSTYGFSDEESFSTLPSRHRDPPVLFGSVRMYCGNKIIESHPPLSSVTDSSFPTPLPGFVLPLHEPYDHALFDLLISAEHDAVVSGNTFVAAVVLSGTVDYSNDDDAVPSQTKRRRTLEFTNRRGPPVRESEIESCHLRFLKPLEWTSGNVAASVTNFGGAPVDAHIDAFERVAPPLASFSLLEAAAGRVGRRHRWHQTQRGPHTRHKRSRDATAKRHPLDAKKAALLESARKYFKDKISFDATSAYSMLEVVAFAQDQAVIEAHQFFEAIEDPLLNMLVPMVVQIVIDAVKPMLMGGLCAALPPILAQIFALPASAAMGSAPGGGGFDPFAALFGFIEKSETVKMRDTEKEKESGVHFADMRDRAVNDLQKKSKRTWRAAYEIEDKPKYDSRGKLMRKPRMTATREQLSTAEFTSGHIMSTLKEVTKRRYGSKARFVGERQRAGSKKASVSDAGACAGLKTMAQCLETRPFPDDGPPLTTDGQPFPHQCAWCTSVAPNAFGVKSACVSCSQVESMEENLAFSCKPSADMCKKRSDDERAVHMETVKQLKKTKRKGQSEQEKFDELLSTEQEIVTQVVGSLIAMLGPVLHLPLSANMHRDVNATVTRATGRTLTQTMTMALTRSLTLSLSQALVRTITAISTKEINAFMTPSLTHAITPAVTQALKHAPTTDYYCYYCREHQVYCNECRNAELESRADDYYAYYYSKYYSTYYARFYGGIYADHAARDAVAHPSLLFADPKEARKPNEYSKYNWSGPELSAASMRQSGSTTEASDGGKF